MKSTRQKGQEFQRWAKKWLEERGWTIHNQGLNHRRIVDPKTKEIIYVSQAQDIFGCVDLIAKKALHKTLWIQCTEDTGRAKKETAMLLVPWSDLDDVQIWMKRGDGHTDIFRLNYSAPEFSLLGKIIRRKFFCTAGVWEF
jgi:hypothetical protein